MLSMHKEREEIKVVSDQIGSPTSTINLAKVCWKLISNNNYIRASISNNVPILHWSDKGIVSWYEIALAVGEIGQEVGILNKAAVVKPIKSTEYKTLAKRPSYSALDSSLTQDILKMKNMPWKQAIRNIINDPLCRQNLNNKIL